MRYQISSLRLANVLVITQLINSTALAGARIDLRPATPPPYEPNQVLEIDIFLVDTGNPQGAILFRGVFLDFSDTQGTFSSPCFAWVNLGTTGGCSCHCWPLTSWVYPLQFQSDLFQITMPNNGEVLLGTLTITIGALGGIIDLMNADAPDPVLGAAVTFGFGLTPNDPVVLWRAFTGELTGGQLEIVVEGGQEPPRIVSANPPNNAIDARQPFSINGMNPVGWTQIDLTFDQQITNPDSTDFDVGAILNGGGTLPGPSISSIVQLTENTVRLNFSNSIRLGYWTRILHIPSATSTRIGFLPADVNGDDHATANDILFLIDALNGVVDLPIWSTDINRSNAAEPSDILREIDLLNGAGAYEVWNGRSMPG